jgi:hypothetical protein
MGVATTMKIGYTNGFKAMAALRRAALDPRLSAIEGDGAMDEGRVFLYAADGWRFSDYDTVGKSVGSVTEIRAALKLLKQA